MIRKKIRMMPGKRFRVSNPIRISLIVVCISGIVVCLFPLFIFWIRWNAQRDKNYMLFEAVVRNDTSTVRHALQAGANINAACTINPLDFDNRIDGTPLSQATLETLPILLEWGANVNETTDEDGETLLHENESPAMVRLLLKNHASPNLRDKRGLTPLDHRLASKNWYIEQHMDTKEIVQTIQLLRKAGAKTGKELDAQAASAQKR